MNWRSQRSTGVICCGDNLEQPAKIIIPLIAREILDEAIASEVA